MFDVVKIEGINMAISPYLDAKYPNKVLNWLSNQKNERA